MRTLCPCSYRFAWLWPGFFQEAQLTFLVTALYCISPISRVFPGLRVLDIYLFNEWVTDTYLFNAYEMHWWLLLGLGDDF